jgi:hypothetical protein
MNRETLVEAWLRVEYDVVYSPIASVTSGMQKACQWPLNVRRLSVPRCCREEAPTAGHAADGQGSAGLGGSPCRSRAKFSFLNRSTPARLLELRPGSKNTAGR